MHHRVTYIPDEGETTCSLRISLFGKGGTVWVDGVTFRQQPPGIRDVLPPNAFRSEGVWLWKGTVAGMGLRMQVAVRDSATGQTLAVAETPVADRVTRFTIPDFTADRRCNLTTRLLDAARAVLDETTVPVFGAPSTD